jgi:hypothetical protein
MQVCGPIVVELAGTRIDADADAALSAAPVTRCWGVTRVVP